MPRPRKQTVDFFPHYCNHSKTIFILEQKYQSRGYAFWFKLLEELGKASGHFLDFNDESYLEFFCAKTYVSGTETLDILGLLARLGAIDKKLWDERKVWSQNFVNNLEPVYVKRVVSSPEKPISVLETVVSGDGKPQSKVKESKVNESKVNLLTVTNVTAEPEWTEELPPWAQEKKPIKKSERREDIDWLLEEFNHIMGFRSAGFKDRFMANHLLKNFSQEQLSIMIQFCATQEYAPRIGSVEKLWYKRGDIIAGIKSMSIKNNNLTIKNYDE